MGQHRFNPTAIAAARGELKPLDRLKTLGSYDLVSRFGGDVLNKRGVGNARPYHEDRRGCIRHATPKVKGKANVKRAKRARIRGRQSAERMAAIKAAA